MMYIPMLEDWVHVEGWDEMWQNPRTKNRAYTLLALANLEAMVYLRNEASPTQQDILEEQRKLGSTLSQKSINQVAKNIKKLAADGHIIYRADSNGANPGENPRGRGGPTSPWSTQYVYPLIRNRLKD
jgi:hypothetical protein